MKNSKLVTSVTSTLSAKNLPFYKTKDTPKHSLKSKEGLAPREPISFGLLSKPISASASTKHVLKREPQPAKLFPQMDSHDWVVAFEEIEENIAQALTMLNIAEGRMRRAGEQDRKLKDFDKIDLTPVSQIVKTEEFEVYDDSPIKGGQEEQGESSKSEDMAEEEQSESAKLTRPKILPIAGADESQLQQSNKEISSSPLVATKKMEGERHRAKVSDPNAKSYAKKQTPLGFPVKGEAESMIKKVLTQKTMKDVPTYKMLF